MCWLRTGLHACKANINTNIFGFGLRICHWEFSVPSATDELPTATRRRQPPKAARAVLLHWGTPKNWGHLTWRQLRFFSSGSLCNHRSRVYQQGFQGGPFSSGSHSSPSTHAPPTRSFCSHLPLYQQKHSSSLEKVVKSTCRKRCCTSEDSHQLLGSSFRERKVMQQSWLNRISVTSTLVKPGYSQSQNLFALIFP